jgi:hypothetical protein
MFFLKYLQTIKVALKDEIMENDNKKRPGSEPPEDTEPSTSTRDGLEKV